MSERAQPDHAQHPFARASICWLISVYAAGDGGLPQPALIGSHNPFKASAAISNDRTRAA